MSDLVLWRGLNNSIYMGAHPGRALFCNDVYMDNMIIVQGGFSIESKITVESWTQRFAKLGNGSTTANGTITAVGACRQLAEQPPHLGTYQQRTETY